jgi:hypothetical protein
MMKKADRIEASTEFPRVTSRADLAMLGRVLDTIAGELGPGAASIERRLLVTDLLILFEAIKEEGRLVITMRQAAGNVIANAHFRRAGVSRSGPRRVQLGSAFALVGPRWRGQPRQRCLRVLEESGTGIGAERNLEFGKENSTGRLFPLET